MYKCCSSYNQATGQSPKYLELPVPQNRTFLSTDLSSADPTPEIQQCLEQWWEKQSSNTLKLLQR